MDWSTEKCQKHMLPLQLALPYVVAAASGVLILVRCYSRYRSYDKGGSADGSTAVIVSNVPDSEAPRPAQMRLPTVAEEQGNPSRPQLCTCDSARGRRLVS